MDIEEKYIVWHIEGSLSKNVMATSLIESLKQKYSDRKIVIVASHPEIFLNIPQVYRAYPLDNLPYFYEDYIKDKDTLVFKHNPYEESSYILNKSHIVESWCKLLDIEYNSQTPQINFNFAQKRKAKKWERPKPILLIQTNGGSLEEDNEYSWSKDIPFMLATQIANKYKNTHHIIQVCKPKSLQLQNVEVINQYIPSIDLFSLLMSSDKRILIDSCLQHVAAAFDLKSHVFWIGTSPKSHGYSLHDNIVANPPLLSSKLPSSYLSQYSSEGLLYECPYMNIDEMFNIPQIIKSI